MALSMPRTALKQVRHNDFLTDQGDRGLSIQYKGTSYDDLKNAANGYRRGDAVENGWVLTNWNLDGVPGGGGLLTINCVPADTFVPEGETSATQYPKDETWTCKTVRNDLSILAYCGPSEGSNPNRVALELWMKETDAELANAFKYHKNENDVEELSEASIAVANKILKGVDTVMRFYPILSRNRKYDNCPDTMLENLFEIDTPPTPSDYIDNPNIPQSSRKKVKKPSNLSTIRASYQWLKVQDDTTEQGDGSFVRTESWMGIRKTNGNPSPWDADLYGANKWPMPYTEA